MVERKRSARACTVRAQRENIERPDPMPMGSGRSVFQARALLPSSFISCDPEGSGSRDHDRDSFPADQQLLRQCETDPDSGRASAQVPLALPCTCPVAPVGSHFLTTNALTPWKQGQGVRRFVSVGVVLAKTLNALTLFRRAVHIRQEAEKLKLVGCFRPKPTGTVSRAGEL